MGLSVICKSIIEAIKSNSFQYFSDTSLKQIMFNGQCFVIFLTVY